MAVKTKTNATFRIFGKVGKYITRKDGDTKNGKKWNLTRFQVSAITGYDGEKPTYSNIPIMYWEELDIEEGDNVLVEGEICMRKNAEGKYEVSLTANNNAVYKVVGKTGISKELDRISSSPSVDAYSQATSLSESVSVDSSSFIDDSNIPF